MGIKLALAVLAAMALGGCYVSKTPLITQANADYPIKDGARFESYVPRGRAWRRDEERVVRREGDHYVYVREGDRKKSPPFLLKRVAKNRYVVQMSDSTDARKVTEYYYQLIDFDGRNAVQYQANCEARPETVTQGLVDKIEETATRRCLFSDLDKLAKVLVQEAPHGAPEGKYVLKR